MPCIRCVGLEEEVKMNVIDEVICTFCAQHYYKTTNHTGSWRIYIATDCSICGGMGNMFPNTDKYNNTPMMLEYKCVGCATRYVWSRSTCWEIQKEIKKPTRDASVNYITGCGNCNMHLNNLVTDGDYYTCSCGTHTTVIDGKVRRHIIEGTINNIKSHSSEAFTATYIKLKGQDPFKDIKLPSKREMYESAYWAFVGSDTGSENEATWYDTMLDRVDLDLQPVEDWHSWVPEPVVAKPVSMGTKIFDGVLKGIQMTILAALMGICMMAAIGVIK